MSKTEVYDTILGIYCGSLVKPSCTDTYSHAAGLWRKVEMHYHENYIKKEE
ncbi:MAG TPA: hypothetical protein HA262_16100 [Methanosarcina sp.]|nr:hypothetical protein [Methanosarcina sp.]